MINPPQQFDGLSSCVNLTQQCNLRCEYCYEHKSAGNLDISTAKNFVDLLLSEISQNNPDRPRVIVDLIGGDALMFPELCDEILSYMQYKLFSTNHRWKKDWRVSIATNGTFFTKKPVQDFLLKWKNNLSIGVSLDGCPELHDRYRRYENGKGSMEDILAGWEWFQQNFPYDALSTKATCSKESIPFLYESLKYLHETMGVKYIHQNFVMEDSRCTEADYTLLDRELEKCVDYVYSHRDDIYWSMISKQFAECHTPTEEDLELNHCGSGLMPSLAINGDIYSCHRWLPFTQSGRDVTAFRLGNANEHTYDPSLALEIHDKAKRRTMCRGLECETCELLHVCPYCVAGCYSELGEFKRTTYSCRFIKLQSKWAKIYWDRYDESLQN